MFYECMRNPHRGNLWEIKEMYNYYLGVALHHTTPVAVPGPRFGVATAMVPGSFAAGRLDFASERQNRVKRCRNDLKFDVQPFGSM